MVGIATTASVVINETSSAYYAHTWHSTVNKVHYSMNDCND